MGIEDNVRVAILWQPDHVSELVCAKTDLLEIVLNDLFEHILARSRDDESLDDLIVGAAFPGSPREMP